MAIKINGQDLLKRYINGQEIVRVYKNGGQIRPETVPPVVNDYLCFTAQENNSTVALNKIGNPTAVSLEISYNKTTWMDYTIGGTIALSNVGDKVYMRNKSETPTGFSSGISNYYNFSMSGQIGASGDINYLVCKYSVTSLGTIFLFDYVFQYLFDGCTSLTTAPQLPATTAPFRGYWGMFEGCTSLVNPPQLPATTLNYMCYRRMFYRCTSLATAPQLPATSLPLGCYMDMFNGCTSLKVLPQLPATALSEQCYFSMFYGCTSIKLSETQTGEYQTPYRIPSSGTGTDVPFAALEDMFRGTGGTFTNDPSINTTYYTSNQVI